MNGTTTSSNDGEQSQFHGDPLVTDDLVVIGTDAKIGHVYAFERATGVVRWKYNVEVTGVASDIVRLENQIYFVTIANDLVCLDLRSGKQKWVFHDAYSPEEHCVTCASPAVSQGRVYFGGRDGFAYAVDAQSGSVDLEKRLGRGRDNVRCRRSSQSLPGHFQTSFVPPRH